MTLSSASLAISGEVYSGKEAVPRSRGRTSCHGLLNHTFGSTPNAKLPTSSKILQHLPTIPPVFCSFLWYHSQTLGVEVNIWWWRHMSDLTQKLIHFGMTSLNINHHIIPIMPQLSASTILYGCVESCWTIPLSNDSRRTSAAILGPKMAIKNGKLYIKRRTSGSQDNWVCAMLKIAKATPHSNKSLLDCLCTTYGFVLTIFQWMQTEQCR